MSYYNDTCLVVPEDVLKFSSLSGGFTWWNVWISVCFSGKVETAFDSCILHGPVKVLPSDEVAFLVGETL